MALPPYYTGNKYTIEEIVKLVKYYIGIEPVFYSPINGYPVYERHVDITKKHFNYYEHSKSYIEIMNIINDDMVELKQKMRNKKLNSLI
ncbi:hypothetical protein M0Q50_08845 [bacterium]|jgi:hypothetical protein|nr:hypothetical protein [bacterium]